MFALIQNEIYIIEGKVMKFIRTENNGELTIFKHNDKEVKVKTEDLIHMDIKEITKE